MTKTKDKLEKYFTLAAVIFILAYPLVVWAINSFKAKQLIAANPYTLNDINLVLIISLLKLVYDRTNKLNQPYQTAGDESKIIPNRNQSDYYEIWDECRNSRKVTFEAIGHSFKTLWFNFIQKFLNEVISNEDQYDKIELVLISTNKDSDCFPDIRTFYGNLNPSISKKITIKLIKADNLIFFTGICVNKSVIWISIREPHKVMKNNEHVREWRKDQNKTAQMMVNWYLGIITYFMEKSPLEVLTSKVSK